MTERFTRLLVLAVGDFRQGLDEVLALRNLGARVLAAGLGGREVKRRLEENGLSTLGIERSKRAAAEAAGIRAGGCDAVLFTVGVWKAAIEAVWDAEQQAALADGRRTIPLLDQGDERYRFLRTPDQWAAFTLARAAGADLEKAKKFAIGTKRGHKKKDTQTRGGRGNRSAAPRKRRGA